MLPRRTYTGGDKKAVGVRLPEELVKALEKIAKETGWTLTDVIQTALDEYVQKNSGKKG